VEVPGLWKAWKAKTGLPTLSTSPLEISPKGGEISTLPQLWRSGLENWKTKGRFPSFPPSLRDHHPRSLPKPTPAAFGRAAALRADSAGQHQFAQAAVRRGNATRQRRRRFQVLFAPPKKNGRSRVQWINLQFLSQRLIHPGDQPFNCRLRRF
jgi:hypothetical protein